MAIQTTRWKPDTCKCVLEYTWNDQEDQAARVHTPKAIMACPIHAHLDTEGAHTEVGNENQSKNQAIGLLVATHPELKAEDIKWEMAANRSVKITLPDSKKPEAANMNGLANGKFAKEAVFE